MNELSLAIYHRLPPAARSAAASLRGLALRRWRYGPETERLVAEAVEREHWSAGRWRQWREERLAVVLHQAATRVPYYRAMWSERRRRGDRRSWERLEHWPLLSKNTLRQSPRLFVSDDCRIRDLYHESTSGTTGAPLDLWWGRETVRAWFALFEARCRTWHGVSRRDRWGILGGQLIVPARQQRPPFWVWNAGLNQLYLSAYHLSPTWMPSYLDAIERYGVRYLWGYSSALHQLAECVLEQGRNDLHLAVALTNAEPLLPHQREAIASAFHCDVRETYGMAEIVAASSECPSGVMHQWPEVGIVEVFDGDQPARPGTSGALVATGLLNLEMPLIRYIVGDRVASDAASSDCTCGRTLPAMGIVEGRSDDVIVTRDGRQLVRLDPIFKAGLPIKEAQIIQETLDQLRVRYVPSVRFNKDAERRLAEAVRARVGDFDIVLEAMSSIPRGANGKFRAVVSAMAAAGRVN